MERNLKEILDQSLVIIEQAAEFISAEFSTINKDQIEYKGFNDLVSYVDKGAEKILVEGLQKVLPDAGILAEEGTGKQANEKYTWIIDPVDGTTNYLHGLPIFAISVALMENDQPIVGIVYEINRREVFTATLGGGAFCNGEPIHVSRAKTLGESLIATGFPYYDFGKMENYLSILHSLMKSSHGLRRLGSAAVDLVYVACGRFESYFEYNLKPWDVAAGTLIVREAGGMVTEFTGSGDPIFGKEILASNALIHQSMIDAIAKHW